MNFENLNNQKQRKEDEYKKATDKNERLQRELQRLQEDDQTLKEKLETYTRENKNLSDQLQESDQTSKENQEMYTSKKKDLSDQLQNLLSVTNSQELVLNETLRKNQALNERMKRKEDECKKATEKWHDMQSENELLHGELQRGKRLTDTLFDTSAFVNKNLKERMQRKEDERKKAKEKWHEIQSENEGLQRELQRQQEDGQTLKKNLETYRKGIENLNNQLQESDQTSKENQEMYTREKKDLSDQLHNLQGVLNSQEKTLDKTLRENQALNERIHRQRAEVETERKAKDDALLRLRAIAAGRLQDNNPNITDLSDENRPTKLGEKMCELYDNEWTDAFDVLETEYDEFKCIQLLLQVFETAFVEISKKATKQMELVREAITWDDQDAKELIKTFKDMRKKKTGFFIIEHSPEIAKTVSEIVGSAAGSRPLQTYINKSIECCWIMVVQDPPLCLHKSQLFESFDTKLYREYTARGPFLQFVVWPTVLLHKGGPILAKGVAQGGPAKEVKEDVDPQSRSAGEHAQTGGNQGGVVNSHTENHSDDDNKQADVDIKYTGIDRKIR